MSRYIEVPANAILGRLRDIASKVERSGGRVVETSQGKEIVFELAPKGRETFVRVYTSLARGDDAVRGCGEDAVRLVIGTEYGGKFRPLSKSRRIYRTAPQGPEEQRIEAFLERFTKTLREAYGQALHDHPDCPKCGSPMARRVAKATKKEFFGCLAFPDCRGSRNIESSTSPAPTSKSPAPKRQQLSRQTRAACKLEGSAEEQLKHLLQTNDWTSDYSDDADARRRGAAHFNKIYTILDCVEPKVARELWREYAPADFDMPLRIKKEPMY